MKRTTSRLLSVSTVFCLSLCSCLFGVRPKADVTLVNVAFKEVTLFETTADVSVRILNQNPEAITIEGGTYTLSVNGTELGTGLSQDTINLAGHGSGIQHVTLHISNITALSKMKSVIESKNFLYDISSEIPVSFNGSKRVVSVNRKGKFGAGDFNAVPELKQ